MITDKQRLDIVEYILRNQDFYEPSLGYDEIDKEFITGKSNHPSNNMFVSFVTGNSLREAVDNWIEEQIE